MATGSQVCLYFCTRLRNGFPLIDHSSLIKAVQTISFSTIWLKALLVVYLRQQSAEYRTLLQRLKPDGLYGHRLVLLLQRTLSQFINDTLKRSYYEEHCYAQNRTIK